MDNSTYTLRLTHLSEKAERVCWKASVVFPFRLTRSALGAPPYALRLPTSSFPPTIPSLTFFCVCYIPVPFWPVLRDCAIRYSMGGLSVVELTHVEDIPYLSMLCTSVTCVTLYTHRYIIQGLIVLCGVELEHRERLYVLRNQYTRKWQIYWNVSDFFSLF